MPLSERIREQLTRPLRKGIAEDLAGTIFEEPVDLAGAILPNVDLRRAHFKQSVNLQGAIFQGIAWLQGVVFEGRVDLSGATFANDARFDSANFYQPAIFSGVQFNGVPCFDRAVFRDLVCLDRIVSSGSFSLQETRFEADVTLADSQCFGGLWATRAIFRGAVETRGVQIYGRCVLPCGFSVAELRKSDAEFRSFS